MVQCWIVVGAAGAGKSSTIRALTGAFAAQARWRTRIEDSRREIYVQTSSLQEAGWAADAFADDVEAKNGKFVLFPLQARVRAGFAWEFAHHFRTVRRWKIQGIGIVGQVDPIEATNLANQGPVMSVQHNMLPTNEIAAVLRGVWKFA